MTNQPTTNQPTSSQGRPNDPAPEKRTTDPRRSDTDFEGDEFEEFKDPMPDRLPTQEESSAADRAFPEVHMDSVAEEYEHMTDLGAHVRGEGQIEPD